MLYNPTAVYTCTCTQYNYLPEDNSWLEVGDMVIDERKDEVLSTEEEEELVGGASRDAVVSMDCSLVKGMRSPVVESSVGVVMMVTIETEEKAK